MTQHRYKRDQDNKPVPINDSVKILPAHLAAHCTRQLVDEIALDIVRGGTPHIAAAAHGVTPYRFREWLRLGHIAAEHGDLEDPHGYLYVAVYQATGLARLGAEQWVFRANPESWLAYALGRDAIRAGAQREVDASHDPLEERQRQIQAEMTTAGRMADVIKLAHELGFDRLSDDASPDERTGGAEGDESSMP